MSDHQSPPTVRVTADPATDLTGLPLVTAVIDPDIARFEEWFRSNVDANTGLSRLEHEMFRSYLYQKLTGAF